MSYEYDIYLKAHKENVYEGFKWMQENIPEVLREDKFIFVEQPLDLEWQLRFSHDQSKTTPEEYKAYDAYFYGGNRSYEVVQNFNQAWNLHIHRNPHHWQYWVLINDDPGEGTITLEMPHNYIVEMICDWWSFSWSQDKLEEIFKWYEEHKKYIMLHPKTRKEVEHILKTMAQTLLSEAIGDFFKDINDYVEKLEAEEYEVDSE